MHPDKILQSDWLDILFDNRNKLYGAYPLRKHEDKRTMLALFYIFFAVAIFVALTIFWKPSERLKKISFDGPSLKRIYTTPYEMPKPPVTNIKPQKQVNTRPVATGSKIKLIDDTFISAPVSAIPADPGLVLPGSGLVDVSIPGEQKVPGIVTHIPEIPPSITKNTASQPLFTAEQMPEYPGGITALRKFLKNNLQNPDVDINENVTVKVRFVVGVDGHLKGFEIIENGGEAFNNEVIRVLKKMPQWIPGKSRGQNVSVYFTLPVIFASGNL